ncbi:hypothetical protein GPECTOR_3g8 [Gonium pectorale]|uniref:Phosphate acetyltransferase n=1 Tax=Gonium pectorale TaxID=33097 RepID=A0A150GZZ0_GONPE|nr:hypothetical protein GPECTOR_3g8 [Gonium pectorale]|eukprot:KXZ55429.1 hypothetical protein GPECTOR_3g8 [Gonium pectorale]
MSDISLAGARTPLLMGFYNYFERHIPNVGYFTPIGTAPRPNSELKIDRHVELLYKVFNMQGDVHRMIGVTDTEASRLIASRQTAALLDRIYSAYVGYKEGKDLVLIEGPGSVMGETELDAQIAAAIGAPVLLTQTGQPNATANDYYNRAMVKRQVFLDHKVDVLGIVMNGLPRATHALLSRQLHDKFEAVGLPFAGAIPMDPLLASVRLDEVQTALGAQRLYGDSLLTDVEFNDVVIACQRLEELLEILAERPSGRPLVITSADRLDIVLGLLAAQLSITGPSVAGILLTQAGSQRSGRNYARLDEVQTALGAQRLYGDSLLTDVEFNDVVIACQRLEELLEILAERPSGRPLVITSADRLDIVLGLLAAQLSITGPSVAGILLTQAGSQRSGRNYARDTIDRIFSGLLGSGLYQGTPLPVLTTDLPLREALNKMSSMEAAILPSSTRKITQCKRLFEQYVDANAVVAGLQRERTTRVTPKMFMHTLKSMCKQNVAHIVLPESLDKRVLAAAADVTQRGLAHITLLGDPAIIQTEAAKLGLDLTGCNIVNPVACERFDAYVDMLVEARKKRGMTKEVASDTLHGDINFFATMMVLAGDADGMVSGAMHTTASTVRPALQVLKTPHSDLASSVFFMCLPDRVLVYGDCAVNVNPTAADLASIAITSADTAAAFGIEPLVAMLSYSTLGSGSGPDVQKVSEAVALVKQRRPDIKVEGPIQYDAAIDPTVAAVKVKGRSEVAGKATVFVFPDLNTGNNTYKAVQQSTGAIAMGPVMQGLLKPVNDLSRGCTVPDIINTICVTSIQATRGKAHGAREAKAQELVTA